MHDLLEAVRGAFSPTILLVTHDRDEAARVADRIALMENGRLLHEGTVAEAYRRPRTLRAAQLMGGRNAVPGQVRDGVHVSALGEVPVPDAVDGAATLVFRQEDVRVDAPARGATSLWASGTVETLRPLGARGEIGIRAAGVLLHAEVPSTSGLRPGEDVAVSVPHALVHVVPS